MCNLGWKCLYRGKLTLPQSWPCPQLRLLSYSVCAGFTEVGGCWWKVPAFALKASEGAWILAGSSILLLRPIADRWGEVAETPGSLHPPHCAGEISQSNLWTGRVFLHRNLHNHFCLLWIFLATNVRPVAKNKQLQTQKNSALAYCFMKNIVKLCAKDGTSVCIDLSYLNMNKTMVITFYRVSSVLFFNVRVW